MDKKPQFRHFIEPSEGMFPGHWMRDEEEKEGE
jgi:hypothetical protein